MTQRTWFITGVNRSFGRKGSASGDRASMGSNARPSGIGGRPRPFQSPWGVWRAHFASGISISDRKIPYAPSVEAGLSSPNLECLVRDVPRDVAATCVIWIASVFAWSGQSTVRGYHTGKLCESWADPLNLTTPVRTASRGQIFLGDVELTPQLDAQRLRRDAVVEMKTA